MGTILFYSAAVGARFCLNIEKKTPAVANYSLCINIFISEEQYILQAAVAENVNMWSHICMTEKKILNGLATSTKYTTYFIPLRFALSHSLAYGIRNRKLVVKELLFFSGGVLRCFDGTLDRSDPLEALGWLLSNYSSFRLLKKIFNVNGFQEINHF